MYKRQETRGEDIARPQMKLSTWSETDTCEGSQQQIRLNPWQEGRFFEGRWWSTLDEDESLVGGRDWVEADGV